jgi:hypothetical protein
VTRPWIFVRVSAGRGSQLRRVGATNNCVVCGMPTLPGVLAFGHIRIRDLHLSVPRDATRVFCLCWHRHHGCYDQSYISTAEPLKAEEIWIENQRRPKPHSRDVALMKRVKAGGVDRHRVWTEGCAASGRQFLFRGHWWPTKCSCHSSSVDSAC